MAKRHLSPEVLAERKEHLRYCEGFIKQYESHPSPVIAELVDRVREKVKSVQSDIAENEASITPNDLVFIAKEIRVAKGYELRVTSNGATLEKVTSPDNTSSPRKEESGPSVEGETADSHFDFERMNPLEDCRMKDGQVDHVTLANLANYRYQAAEVISRRLGIDLRDLKDVRFAENIKPFWYSLKGSGFLDAEFSATPEQIDVYTANIMVFRKAIEQGLLFPSTDTPMRIEMKNGKTLIFYRLVPVPGSQSRWELVATTLPSFRNIDLRF